LVRFSLNRAHYCSGRWFLVAQGLACVALGFHISAVHGVALAAFGALVVLAARRRGSAVVLSALGAVLAITLVLVSSVAAVHHASGVMEFRPGSILLFGLIAGYDIALVMWLCPDAVEGKVWRYRVPLEARTPDRPADGGEI
jgi:lysylphosphatidylglycerol synthetase-like protein (DUF2156 family)